MCVHAGFKNKSDNFQAGVSRGTQTQIRIPQTNHWKRRTCQHVQHIIAACILSMLHIMAAVIRTSSECCISWQLLDMSLAFCIAAARLINKMQHKTAAVSHVFNMPHCRGGFWTCPQPAAYHGSCEDTRHATALLAEIVCKFYKTFEDGGKQACSSCKLPCA